jgi:hypothetical protein
MRHLHLGTAVFAVALAITFLFGAEPAFASTGLMAATGLGIGAQFGLIGGARLAMTAAERRLGRFLRGPDGHGDEGKTADQLVGEVKSLVERKHGEVKAIADEALGKAKAGEELTAATKELADQALSGLNEAKARLDEIEQKLVRTGPDKADEVKTAGQTVAESEELKSWLAGPRKGTLSIGVKAIISSLTTAANGSAGDLIVPQRQPGIVTAPQRRMTIRDLLTPGRTASNAIQYVKESGFTNSAATVSETAGHQAAVGDPVRHRHHGGHHDRPLGAGDEADPRRRAAAPVLHRRPAALRARICRGRPAPSRRRHRHRPQRHLHAGDGLLAADTLPATVTRSTCFRLAMLQAVLAEFRRPAS